MSRLKGKLFIVEGIDGSGKSTQLTLLSQWLRSEGHLVVFSEWNSSPIVRTLRRSASRPMKRLSDFTPAAKAVAAAPLSVTAFEAE